MDWSVIFWGLSTLLGAIVGGILSRSTARSIETQRWRREDAKRFEADRRHAYIQLLRLSNEIAEQSVNTKAVESQITTDFKNLLAEIEIISSPDTRKHALAFGQVIANHVYDPNNKQHPVEAWAIHRKTFIDAVHRELGTGVLSEPLGSTSSDEGLGAMLPEGLAKNLGSLQAQTNLPIPLVTGAIGLILAFAISGGLSGGQGFLVGFVVGLTLLIFIAVRLDRINAG